MRKDRDPVSMMPQSSRTDEDRERRLATCAEALRRDRRDRERIDAKSHHDIVAAWNAGMSESRIAELLGLSRTPIHAYLARASAIGELARPLAPSRAR